MKKNKKRYKILVHTEPNEDNIRYWEVYREGGKEWESESIYEAVGKYEVLANTGVPLTSLKLVNDIAVRVRMRAGDDMIWDARGELVEVDNAEG